MKESDTITVSEADLKTLKMDYRKALDSGAESFRFKGKEVLTSYAKYMIEYLEGEFGKKKN
jgi:hypothetical protein